MPSAKSRLQIAPRTDHKALEPPADLWEKLDAAVVKLKADAFAIPPDAFTRQDFEAQFNLSFYQAHNRLRSLQKGGIIKKIGRSGPKVYYVLV